MRRISGTFWVCSRKFRNGQELVLMPCLNCYSEDVCYFQHSPTCWEGRKTDI
jgi:hypothetical protein